MWLRQTGSIQDDVAIYSIKYDLVDIMPLYGSDYSVKKRFSFIAMTTALAVVLILAIPTFRAFSTPAVVTVMVDGQVISFQGQSATIVDGRTLVPIRGVFETMGFEVHWDHYERIARLEREDFVIIIPAGMNSFVVNSQIITPDVPQELLSGRMMLPLRAIAEAIGGTAYWDSNGRIATIISPNSESGPPTSTPLPTLPPPTITPPPAIPTPTPHPTLPPDWNPQPPSTPCPHSTPSPTFPPNPLLTINDLLFAGYPTRDTVFDVEVFRVENGEIVSEIAEVYGCNDNAFAIWAMHNNVTNVELVSSGILMTQEVFFFPSWDRPATGLHREIGLNLSPEFFYYFEGENGLLLADSLAYTFMHMWRPVGGLIRFGLIICEETTGMVFLSRPEDALFAKELRVTLDDYPHR